MTNWSEYDSFVADAERDNRVGDHDAIVESVTVDTWPNSGDKRIKILFTLSTANNAKADLTLGEIPPASVLASMDGMDHKKKKGIAHNITLQKQLDQYWGMQPEKLVMGTTLKVKTRKSPVDPITQKGGFIRVVAFLPKDAAISAPKATTPF